LATAYIDDIVDSGKTRSQFSDKPFFALVDKQEEHIDGWVTFPWERMSGEEQGPVENVRRLIEFIGDDPNREGLKETPDRVLKSYGELFSGYKQDPSEVLKLFEDDTCDEMVVLKDIEFYSVCEHHMLPFFGKALIAYIPKGRVVGISKLVRLLEVFSRRLQIQERLCEQVTTALDDRLKPKGSACILEATHFCMTSRGVQKQHSKMITSSLTGAFRRIEVRSELMHLLKGE
jgi:GTP cyclohydrolase I